jgi:hypothetical protein
VSFVRSGVDSMAISEHKLHGPKGVGCLVAREPGRLRPLVLGGGQERGHRSGTENIPGCVGFAAALAAARTTADHRLKMRTRLEAALPDRVDVVCAASDRLPGHSLLKVSGVRAELLVLALDREGYAVAAGSACSAGDAEPSHVLVAQGMSAEDARSVIRVSMGAGTTGDEVDGLAAALDRSIGTLRQGDPARGVTCETRRHITRLPTWRRSPRRRSVSRMADEPGARPGGDSRIGAVILVVAALAVTMVGIALAAWYGGKNHAGTTTVTVTTPPPPSRQAERQSDPPSPPALTTSSASRATSATATRARATSRPTCPP